MIAFVDWHYTIAFLALGVPLAALELWGVHQKRKGDTISENVWWLRDHQPVLFAVVMHATRKLADWLPEHFRTGGH
jgi:hypothetical protein